MDTSFYTGKGNSQTLQTATRPLQFWQSLLRLGLRLRGVELVRSGSGLHCTQALIPVCSAVVHVFTSSPRMSVGKSTRFDYADIITKNLFFCNHMILIYTQLLDRISRCNSHSLRIHNSSTADKIIRMSIANVCFVEEDNYAESLKK